LRQFLEMELESRWVERFILGLVATSLLAGLVLVSAEHWLDLGLRAVLFEHPVDP